MDNSNLILHRLASNPDEEYTLHELSQKLGIPYTTFLREIKRIESAVRIRKKGRSKLISIRYNELARAYATIASYTKTQQAFQNYPVLAKIAEETTGIALVFGSYAKGTQTKDSDIDILVVGESNTRRFSKQQLLFKKQINPITITHEEFAAMLRADEENVVKQALRDHIILSGHEAFWKEVSDVLG